MTKTAKLMINSSGESMINPKREIMISSILLINLLMMRVYTSRFRYKHYLKPSITTISDEQCLLKDPSFVQVTLTRIIPPKGTAFFQVRFWVDS